MVCSRFLIIADFSSEVECFVRWQHAFHVTATFVRVLAGCLISFFPFDHLSYLLSHFCPVTSDPLQLALECFKISLLFTFHHPNPLHRLIHHGIPEVYFL